MIEIWDRYSRIINTIGVIAYMLFLPTNKT